MRASCSFVAGLPGRDGHLGDDLEHHPERHRDITHPAPSRRPAGSPWLPWRYPEVPVAVVMMVVMVGRRRGWRGAASAAGARDGVGTGTVASSMT
jgi:hypothetical protein